MGQITLSNDINQKFEALWYIGQAMKKNLILCLAFVLLGSAQVNWRQDFEKGLEP